MSLFGVLEVDPNTLGETAKALLWVIGALLAGGGGYFMGRKQKVQLDPNRVEVAPDAFTQLRKEFSDRLDQHRKALECSITDNEKAHENIFLRLTTNEKDVAEIKGQLPHMNQALHRIENKLDTLLGKVKL